MNSKRPPILLSGLILGLFGLANLLLNYHSIFFYFLNGLALILWIYLTLALVLSFSDYRQDLQKAPFLSSFATYPMASMLLAAQAWFTLDEPVALVLGLAAACFSNSYLYMEVCA